MTSDRRGRSGLSWGAFGVVLAIGLSACVPLWGGVAVLGLVSISALTSRCYDYLDATVLDADGRKTCAATVTASIGGSQFELPSCYAAPLTDGHWTLRASLPGFSDAISNVEVEHAHDCTRHVQTVELTLNRTGSPPTVKPTLPAPPAVALPPATVPAPPLSPSSIPPAVDPAAAGSANSAQPPVGVFPDQPETSH